MKSFLKQLYGKWHKTCAVQTHIFHSNVQGDDTSKCLTIWLQFVVAEQWIDPANLSSQKKQENKKNRKLQYQQEWVIQIKQVKSNKVQHITEINPTTPIQSDPTIMTYKASWIHYTASTHCEENVFPSYPERK